MSKRPDTADSTIIEHDQASGASRRRRGAYATGTLLAVWSLLTLGSFMLDDTLAPRFLDMPLGAFLAGQGALMGLVIVGMRVARADLDYRRH
jgi:putative solute:sodium symporter small subunit